MFSNGGRPPQYVGEVEALLGTDFFDDDREVTVHENFEALDPNEIGSRALLYTRAMRILAMYKIEDRQVAEAQDDITDIHEWNQQWRPGVKKLAQISQQATVDIRPITRWLSMVKNIEASLAEEMDGGSLHSHQMSYYQSIAKFMQHGPSRVQVNDGTGRPQNYFVHGATVEAPTGIGKTVMQARTLNGLGIGRQADNPNKYEGVLRALEVVPSQDLVQQFTGLKGDDTFRRFLPDDTSVGAYYAYQKQLDTDVIVTTIDQFTEKMRDNRFDGEEIDVVIIDEVHHLVEPKFHETFKNHWSGPAIGFTGTPAYAEDRDVRTILPHTIYHGDTLRYIEDGALNAAQLLLFRINPRQHHKQFPAIDMETYTGRSLVERTLIEKSATDLIYKLVSEGRRGIVYTAPGDESASARQLASTLRQLRLPNGKQIHAEALGSFRKNAGSASNAAIQRDYADRNVDVLTTVNYGHEGLNADIDFVIITSPTASLLRLRQIIGRGTRLSGIFPTTIYAQFITPNEGNGTRYCSLFEAFGLDVVEQGRFVGKATVSGSATRSTLEIKDLPPDLRDQAAIVDGRLTGQVFLAGDRHVDIPDGYINLEADLKLYHPAYLRQLLNYEGYQWVGRYEVVQGDRQMVRYYEPAAYEFVKARIDMIIKDEVPLSRIAADEGISAKYLRILVKRQQIETVKCLNGSNQKILCVTPENYAKIKEIINSVPTAQDGDMTVHALGRMLNVSGEVLSTRFAPTTYSMRNPMTRSVSNYILKSDVDRIAKEFVAAPIAAPEDMNMAQISKQAGINQGEFRRLVSKEDIGLAVTKRHTDGPMKNKELLLWSKADGERIIKQLESLRITLPPHAVPLMIVETVLNVTIGGAKKELKRRNLPYYKLRLPGAPAALCIDWPVLEQLEMRYGRHRTVRKIDYSRLPSSADDDDDERAAYARALQYSYIDAGRLGFTDLQIRQAKQNLQNIYQRRPLQF